MKIDKKAMNCKIKDLKWNILIYDLYFVQQKGYIV